MVRASKAKGQGFDPHLDHLVVFLSKIHLLHKSTGNIQEAVMLRLDMTEKLFTGTLRKKETKRKPKYVTPPDMKSLKDNV